MKRFRLKSLLPQYILLYTLVVFTPVLIIFLSLLQSNRALEAEILNSNQSTITFTQNALDNTFLEIENTLDYLGTDSNFSRYSMSNNPLNAIDSLQQSVQSFSYLSDIMIFSLGDDYLYANDGRFHHNGLTYADFLQDYLKAGYTTKEWVDTLRTVKEPFFWPKGFAEKSDTIFYFSPIYYENQSPLSDAARSAVMVIRQDFIQELFLSSRSTESDSMLLLDNQLDLLCELSAEEDRSDVLSVCAYVKEHPEIFEQGYCEIDSEGLLVFATRSEKTGLSYVRFLPKAVAYQSLESQIGYAVAMAVLAFLTACVLISLAIRQSYSPIKKLATWVRNQEPNADLNTPNELTLFHQALSNAYSHNEALTETINLSRQGLIDHFLANLLSGNFNSKEDFLAACKQYELDLDKPHYAVCSILFEEGDELPEFSQLSSILCSDLPDTISLVAKNMLLERKIIVVLGCDHADYDLYTILITDLKNRLLEQESLLTSIGMGSFYHAYDLIGKSYLDSVNALDYRLVYGKDCLITPDIYNNNTPDLSDSYPSTDLELLDSSLAARNIKMAATTLQRINANIKLKSYSLHIAKYICYDIFSIFRKHADSPDSEDDRTLIQTLDITKLTNYSTVDEFFSTLQDLMETNYSENQLSESPQSANLGAMLLEYTDAHCLSYDFQAKTMAEHFNISPQYMRKLFKSHTGMSISDYVSNKRLEKSMHLLSSTDMNLQDIVISIGNSDISGFVRFFKQKTGMTPGQYRKAKQTQQEKESV